MGFALNRAFESSVLSNAEDALRNQVLLLIANIDVIDGQVVVPPLLPEPRLSQTDSDLYAQITATTDSVTPAVVWRSRSLLDKKMPILGGDMGQFGFYQSTTWEGEPKVYSTTLGVEWETEQGDFPFTVQVAEHAKGYTKRLSRYQRQVGFSLLVLGGSLVLLLLVLLGWALKPLNRVTKQVGEIEEGKRRRFDEDYPLEVSRLTQNLNQLLNFEEQRIERQKQVLGNLAHSLKTPIAILTGLDYPPVTANEAKRQLTSMQTIIDYQLQSASAVGRQRFAKPINVQAITQQIIASLDKLHHDKGVTNMVNIADSVQFFGDQGDWMELAGNLLDNAYKWANSRVAISVENTSMVSDSSHRLSVKLVVEDDGDGIDAERKATILERGVRLDSQTPGHGLGLHIVKGIVEAYAGQLMIDDSGNGEGTRFTVILN